MGKGTGMGLPSCPAEPPTSRLWRNLTILIGLVALFLFAYYLWPDFRSGFQRGWSALTNGEIAVAVERLKDYLRSFGIWAPLVSAALMVLQSIAFPVPGQIVTISNGLLFGAFWGFWLSWGSAMVGATVCFSIARMLGRPTVEKLASKRTLSIADRFFEKYGSNSILVARLLPVMPFDAISYLAGATSISYRAFFIATAIGQVPMTIVYSMFGQNLTKLISLGIWAVGIVLALIVLVLTFKQAFEKRLSGRRQKSTVEAEK
ncbi:MAG: TVP38/TMEM64 family protein [Chloroflexi bacterium]|nr:TVP38/TMEM64 family protein [Chloroflexota bacterium]